MSSENRKICLGAIAGAHGVRGHFKIKAFTESPGDIASYGPLSTEDGARRFVIKIVKDLGGGVVIATAPEVATREEAQALKGERLYVDRAVLPAPDADEFYFEDLVGLKAIGPDGKTAGVVKAVYNFGAGDIIELGAMPDRKGVLLIPFTNENFPAVDIKAGQITLSERALDDESDDPAATMRFQEAATRAEDA